jgi:hypothetical protein
MSGERDERYVACPYFLGINTEPQRRQGAIIRCEGVSKDNVITLTFDSKNARKVYKRAFCYSIHKCRECLIHQMLNRKYGVDDEI